MVVVRQLIIIFVVLFSAYAEDEAILPEENIPDPIQVSMDEIVLVNGDILSGDLVLVDKSFIYFKYGFLDKKVEIAIPRQEVARLSVKHPVYVASSTGEVSFRTFQSDPDNQFSEISSITLKDPNEPPPPPQWHGQLDCGVQGHGGNNKTLDVTGGADAKLEKEYSSYYILVRLVRNTVDNVDTASNGYSKLKYKYWPYSVSGKIYINAYTTNEYDYVQKLNLRSRLGAGVGYRCYKSDEDMLECEVGGASTYEDLTDGLDDRTFGSIRASAYIAKQICEDIKLHNGLEVFPGLKDKNDFYIRDEFSLATAVNKTWELSFTILVIHDNVPASPELEKTNWTTGLGLTRKF